MPQISLSLSKLPYIPIKGPEQTYLNQIARDKHISLAVCPTCDNRETELAPGIEAWEPSEYQLHGEMHPCDCETQVRLQMLYLLAGIPKGYWTLGWDDFYGDPEAKTFTQEYLDRWEAMKRSGIGLSFYSPTQGTGKTMLSTLVAKDLIKRGEKVTFVHFSETVRLYQLPHEERQEIENRLRHTPLLILDEVRQAISDSQGALYAANLEELIRFRVSGNAVTISTSNLTQKELDQQYFRAFSLLAEKQQFVHVNGQDVRRSGEVQLERLTEAVNDERRPLV